MRAAYWWIDRWRKSTAYTDMTLAEQGAYRNLLDELWLRDGLLPLSDRAIAKISGDAIEWPKLREVVMARFIRTPQGYRNETHDAVSGGYKSFRDAQAEKGRKRATAAKRGPAGTFQPSQPETSRNTSQQPAKTPADEPASVSVSVSVSESVPASDKNDLPVATQPRQAEARQNGFAEDVKTVVKHYQTHHPRSRPGDKEKALIRKRLQPPEKWTVAELCQAIDGYHESPHHCGDNDRGTKYLGLSLIFRDSAHVQAGVEFADGNGFAGKEEPRCACKRLLQSDESKATGVCQDCREHGKEHAR